MGTFDWAGLAGAGFGAAGNFFEGEANRRFQREVNDKNEALMREAWGREDNAVQRQAADMEAAGLSKTLAAGGGASSGSPIKLESLKSNAGDVVQGAMEGAAFTKNIAQTEAQTKLTQEQTKTQKEIGRKAAADAKSAESDQELKRIALRVERQLRGEVGETLEVVPGYNNELDYKTQAELTGAHASAYESATKKTLYERYWQEINDLEMKMRRSKATSAEKTAAKDKLVVELLQKELKWYRAKAIGGLIGNITGSIAKTANAANQLNLVGE